MITTVVPYYNNAETLWRALQSVLGQAHLSEVIVVDDASPGISAEQALAGTPTDARIRHVRLATNLGPAGARNVGLALAFTPFVALLDADDEHLPGFYEQAAGALLAHPQLAAVRGHIELAGTPSDWSWQAGHDGQVGDARYRAILASGVWANVYRRAALTQLGGFPTDAGFRGPSGGEDAVTLGALTQTFSTAQLGTVVVRHHVHERAHLRRWWHTVALNGTPPHDRLTPTADAPPPDEAQQTAVRAHAARWPHEVQAHRNLHPAALCPQPWIEAVVRERAAGSGQYEFSNAWFAQQKANWAQWLAGWVGQPNIHALELGCYEGQCSVWLLDHVLTHPGASLTVVDTFAGSVEHNTVQKASLLARFQRNAWASAGHGRLRVFACGTAQALRAPLVHIPYDLIYVDADHHAAAVLQDAVLAWPLLKPGGLMIFDDYLWADMPQEWQRPKAGVDAFLHAYGAQLEVLHQGYQVLVRKKS